MMRRLAVAAAALVATQGLVSTSILAGFPVEAMTRRD
jgi:hypothetical protein